MTEREEEWYIEYQQDRKIDWLKTFFYATAINYIIMMSLSVLVQYELLNDWVAKGIVVFAICVSIMYVMNRRDKGLNITQSIP